MARRAVEAVGNRWLEATLQCSIHAEEAPVIFENQYVINIQNLEDIYSFWSCRPDCYHRYPRRDPYASRESMYTISGGNVVKGCAAEQNCYFLGRKCYLYRLTVRIPIECFFHIVLQRPYIGLLGSIP
jgi:hypothetical protein